MNDVGILEDLVELRGASVELEMRLVHGLDQEKIEE